MTGALGVRGLYRRIARGRNDTDTRFDHLPGRIWYALVTTLTQSRTFRKRPVISLFHSFIFYGFTFYLLVNLVDAIDGFIPLSFASLGLAGNLYVLSADMLSALVLIGIVALVTRKKWTPKVAVVEPQTAVAEPVTSVVIEQSPAIDQAPAPKRKTWAPKQQAETTAEPVKRKAWSPKSSASKAAPPGPLAGEQKPPRNE